MISCIRKSRLRDSVIYHNSIKHNSTKIELLAPAGNPEKLKTAIHYGADAVYLGGQEFSLRNFAGNFSPSEMADAVQYAHAENVKVYAACNIYSRTHENDAIRDYLLYLQKIKVDAVIFSDPGIWLTAREFIPDMPLHLSTQANTTNLKSVLFWKRLGLKRINLARELSFQEISQLTNLGLEIEIFGHGALCIAYSGRCLLSNFMTLRDSNHGKCCHPCRFQYTLMEESRPNQFFPVMEDQRGTYIMNSRDLCTLNHIPQLISTGVCSLKIEGRMKGLHYLATVVKIYRKALDAFYASPDTYEVKAAWRLELEKINHRGYCTGFYCGDPRQIEPDFNDSAGSQPAIMVGKVVELCDHNMVLLDVRNRILKADMLEIITSKGDNQTTRILEMTTANTNIKIAQPNSRIFVKLEGTCYPGDLLRRIENV